jgi:hypothetical protein
MLQRFPTLFGPCSRAVHGNLQGPIPTIPPALNLTTLMPDPVKQYGESLLKEAAEACPAHLPQTAAITTQDRDHHGA